MFLAESKTEVLRLGGLLPMLHALGDADTELVRSAIRAVSVMSISRTSPYMFFVVADGGARGFLFPFLPCVYMCVASMYEQPRAVLRSERWAVSLQC